VWPVYTPDSGPDPVDCSELEAEVARLEAEVAALQALVGGNYDVAYNDGWNAGLQSLIAPLLK